MGVDSPPGRTLSVQNLTYPLTKSAISIPGIHGKVLVDVRTVVQDTVGGSNDLLNYFYHTNIHANRCATSLWWLYGEIEHP